jgi:hypothetical protein
VLDLASDLELIPDQLEAAFGLRFGTAELGESCLEVGPRRVELFEDMVVHHRDLAGFGVRLHTDWRAECTGEPLPIHVGKELKDRCRRAMLADVEAETLLLRGHAQGHRAIDQVEQQKARAEREPAGRGHTEHLDQQLMGSAMRRDEGARIAEQGNCQAAPDPGEKGAPVSRQWRRRHASAQAERTRRRR